MGKLIDWKNNINTIELDECVDIIKNGGIAVFPTDTVYGIGTNAFCKQSVDKIYEIKKRPNEKPLSILVNNKEDIEKYAIINNNIERKIIDNFMPGAITIILERKQGILDYIAPEKNTIGIRIPNNKIILNILEKLKLPIVAPSANMSGEPSSATLNDIIDIFKDKVDVCIDGGKCEVSEASTIVQVINGEIVIIREGIITKKDIENVINKN